MRYVLMLLALIALLVSGCSDRPRPINADGTPAPVVMDYGDVDQVLAALARAEGEAQRLRAVADELERQGRAATVRMWQRIAWLGAAACGALMALFIGLSVWQSGAGPWLRLAMVSGVVGGVVLGLGVAIPTIAWVAPILVGVVLLAGVSWVVAGLVRQYRAARVGVESVDAALARIPQERAGELLEWMKQYHDGEGAREAIRAHLQRLRAGGVRG